MAVTCYGIDMYDPRTAQKAVAAEDIGLGESVYIHTDGLAYLVDNGKSDVMHGVALMATSSGSNVTIVTQARLKLATTQTIGARIYTGGVSGGSAPSTTLSATGVVCGFALDATHVYVNVPVPGADG